MQNIFWNIDLTKKPTCFYIGNGISEEHNNRTYCLPNLWCAHLYNFTGMITIEEGSFNVNPGDIGFMPPGKSVKYTVYGKGTHVACHFNIDCSDSEKTDELPALMHTGSQYSKFEEEFKNILEVHSINEFAADIKLWNLLIDVECAWKKLQHKDDQPCPILEKCVNHIEQNLAQNLNVANLVKMSGMSHPVLIELFKEHTNTTITEYIQKRRMAKAHHLLVETDQPVKAVAIECGFSDLQYFNKCVRKAFGLSPRALRS